MTMGVVTSGSSSGTQVGVHIPSDEWYFASAQLYPITPMQVVAVYKKGQSLSLYVNGVLAGSTNLPNKNLLVSAFPIGTALGAYDETGYPFDYLSGTIDDFRVYNRALSASEVQQLYAYESVPSTNPPPSQALLNTDFAPLTVRKTGPAAVGQAASDYWNNFGAGPDSTLTNLLWSDQTASGVNMRVQNAPGGWGNSTGDPMFDGYSYSYGGNITVTLSNLPAGTYDVYLYGHGNADNQNSVFVINGQTKQTAVGPYWNNNQLANGGWLENNHYVIFHTVQAFAGVPLTVTVTAGVSGYTLINGMQLISVPASPSNTTVVSLTASPSNGGTVNGGGTFYIGSQVQISATPNSGWTFIGWNDGNTQNPRTITVPSNSVAYVASFTTNTAVPSSNLSFETPSLGSGYGSYQYNPAGGSWTFSGASPNGSGLLGNGSAFGNPNAPDGTQAAFVQSYGTISQTLSGFTPGTNYTITYSAAQRSGTAQHGGESWKVCIDNNVIKANNPGVTSYTTYTATFTASTPTHALSFVGTDLAGGDNTVFIDNVTINPPISATVVMNETLPTTATDVVGSQVTFTASVARGGPVAYQWQAITGGATNNIPGATNTTLTLTNLQLTDTASYRLLGSNNLGVAVSTTSTLVVSSIPAAVNNVVTSVAAQTGLGKGTTFTPTWTVLTNNSLIANQSPSSAVGNFSLELSGRSVISLTDGIVGGLTQATSTNYVTCGSAGGAGSSVIYTLAGPATGYNLTNITVYGGWTDAGRDQQAYTVSYSTVAAPASFISLGRVNYNPANPASVQSTTRVTLTPASGALAKNVAAVKFDFTTPASENGYCGYSEIILAGVPSPQPVLPIAPTSLPAGTSDANPLDLGFFVGGTTLSIQVSGMISLGGSWFTWPDGSLVAAVTDTSYLYANAGSRKYPNSFGGDGVNHFPGGGANFDVASTQFGIAGAMTTDTTDHSAIRFGSVIGTFSGDPDRTDWFFIGSSTPLPFRRAGQTSTWQSMMAITLTTPVATK